MAVANGERHDYPHAGNTGFSGTDFVPVHDQRLLTACVSLPATVSVVVSQLLIADGSDGQTFGRRRRYTLNVLVRGTQLRMLLPSTVVLVSQPGQWLGHR